MKTETYKNENKIEENRKRLQTVTKNLLSKRDSYMKRARNVTRLCSYTTSLWWSAVFIQIIRCLASTLCSYLQIKRSHFNFVITVTVVKLFSKFLKLATSHIFLHLLMYSNCPPHLNYATTLPCENYNNKIGQF